MPSRGKTAPQSQASNSKPSRAQTRPKTEANRGSSDRDQQTGASRHQDTRANRRQQQTRAGRPEDTRASRRQETRGSRRTLKTQGDGRDGGKKSLFSQSREGKSGTAGEKLKTDDVWNKFLDDKDVVRAPTADLRQPHVRTASDGATDTDDSEYYSDDSEDSYDDEDETVDEEDEDDDDDDARTIYSNYYLDGYEYYEPKGPPKPRAEILDGKTYEVCSCYPNRGDKTKGSMLYDKITCKHNGLTGHTHPGVYKFNPYWNENMEIPRKLRKRDMSYPQTTFLFGYPKPRFELWSDSEEETTEGSYDGTPGASDRNREKGRRTGSYISDDDSSYDDDSDYDSRDDYDKNDDTEGSGDEDDEDYDYVPFKLPKIGYPKTPSLPRSSQSSLSFRSRFSDVPDSLPEVPGSRQLTGMRTGDSKRLMTTQRSQKTRQETRKSMRTTKTPPRTVKTSKSRRITARFSDSDDDDGPDSRSRRRGVSRQSLPKGPVINTERTFQGKYYDPLTKQVMLFDIKKESDKHLPGGIIEPLYKPPPTVPQQTAQKKPDSNNKQQGSPGRDTETVARSQNEQSKPGGIGIKAAVLGNMFISSMLKSVKKKDK